MPLGAILMSLEIMFVNLVWISDEFMGISDDLMADLISFLSFCLDGLQAKGRLYRIALVGGRRPPLSTQLAKAGG